MHIDCSTCIAPAAACGDCVVTLLLSLPAPDAQLSENETAALEVLADSGLVPRLRLVSGQ